MANSEEIAQQRGLLEIHRRNLAQYLKQRAQFGDAYVPPVISNGIVEERENIARVKRNLRDWSSAVADHPNDSEPAQNEGTSDGSNATRSRPSGSSMTNNFYGSITTGPAAFGGQQQNERTGSTVSENYTVSNVSGSNITIKSTLTNVNQTIGGMPGGQAAKDELKRLFEQLQAELEKAPLEGKEAAEETAKRASAAAEEAAKPKPDTEDVQYSLGRLQKAAKNIGKLMPTVVPIAAAIAKQIMDIVAG